VGLDLARGPAEQARERSARAQPTAAQARERAVVRLRIAGARIDAEDAVARNIGRDRATLSFSVTEVSRGGGTPAYVHRVVRIDPEKDW